MAEYLNTDNWNHVIRRCGRFLYQTATPTKNPIKNSKQFLGGIYIYQEHKFEIKPVYRSKRVQGFTLFVDGVEVFANPELHDRGLPLHSTVLAARLAAFGHIYNL